jgi:hypothetical protein
MTTYQGLFLEPNEYGGATPSDWDFRNVDTYGLGAYDYWLADVGPGQVGRLPDFTLQNVYDCDPTSPRTIDGTADGGVAWAVVRGCPTPGGVPFKTAMDGRWHLVECAKGPGGMSLDVDGQNVAANAFTGPTLPYVGYWVIGDRRAGDGPRRAIVGQIAQVGIYVYALSQAQDANHWAIGQGQPSTGD